MKKAIFCVALGKKNRMHELSIKSLDNYAKKIGAELIVHKTPYFNINWELAEKFKTKKMSRYAWVEKLYAFELLKEYDRVLLIDTDILVTPHAPDIFSAYPDDTKTYALSETVYDTRLDRDGQKDIRRIESALGSVEDWPAQGELRRYFNSGVVLLSKKSNIHTYFSLKEVEAIFNQIVYLDQTYLNYLFFKYHLAMGELDSKYNWIAHLHIKKQRHQGYFIHHSLNGYSISKSLKTQTFINDYCRYYQNPITYRLGIILRSFKSGYLLLKHNINKRFWRKPNTISSSTSKKITVAVSGGFDPIHIGHVRLLKEAKALGDVLVVILNNNHWLASKKGYTFMDEQERAEILKSIRYVDEVILTTHQPHDSRVDVCHELELIKPDIFANGGDRSATNIPEYATCQKINCHMEFNVGGGKKQSSSWLTNKIKTTPIQEK